MIREDSKTARENSSRCLNNSADTEGRQLSITVCSFGYKAGTPPVANIVLDVRFLQNPYWVPELRPLTGLDSPVREYVLTQSGALELLDSLTELLSKILPRVADLGIFEFSIAFGCTGGQHRSAALAEALAERLEKIYPKFAVSRHHRELGEVQQ